MEKKFIKFLEKFDLDICCCGFNKFLTEEEKQILSSPEENPNYQFGNPLSCGCLNKKEIKALLIAYKNNKIQEFIKVVRDNCSIDNQFDVASWREWKQKKEKRQKLKERKRKVGYIYILESGELFKIGRTLNSERRFETYKTQNPFGIKVIILRQVNDYVGVETELLKQYKSKRINGEWFKLDKEDIKKIEEFIKTKETNL